MSRAKPMSPNRRIFGYLDNTGRTETPRQRRRRLHKLGHLAALERKTGSSSGLIADEHGLGGAA